MEDTSLSLRDADITDCERLFEWANDPDTRANSFSTTPITWEAHCDWLAKALRDPARKLYIVLVHASRALQQVPLGQVRFDISDQRTAAVSVNIAPAWRGKRLAAPSIRLATERLVNANLVSVVSAFVKPANEASRRAFARAGYLPAGVVRHGDQEALRLDFSPAASQNRQ